MVQINFALKEVNCKIVYYGPGLSGKTTNLEVIHNKAPNNNVGELTSIATEGDRTLFFDFLPLNLGSVAGMQTKFQIYTVPGQVYYNSTRKLVLQGADGIVFVADSRRGKMDENLESLSNLMENLHEYGMDVKTIPLVIQYNKRDLPDVYSPEELNEKLNHLNVPHYEAVAVTGEGVFPTLKKLSQMVLENLNRQQGSTVVKAPKKKEAKEPVAVGAQARAKATAAATQATSAVSQRPRSSAPSRSVAERKSGVVKESVTSSPGVKQIERKKPSVDSVIHKRSSMRKTQGGKTRTRTNGVRPSSRKRIEPPKKSSAALWFFTLLLVLGVVGSALYFTGLLDPLLSK
tara:strand:+ start:41 stop:1078 length:1038 start_codon:yes stop_codon:yes gene_type:complete